MPSGGHNKLTPEQRRLRGTSRPAREKAYALKAKAVALAVPSAPSLVPEPPKYLKPFEVEVWHELKPQLERLGHFKEWQTTSLGNLCGAIARARHPDFPAGSLATLTAVIARMMKDFGLSPSVQNILQPPATAPEAEATPAAPSPLRFKPFVFTPNRTH